MLDNLSPALRHFIILVIGAALTYASTAVTDVPAKWQPIIGAVVSIVTLIVTPLTRQYGVGSDAADANNGD